MLPRRRVVAVRLVLCLLTAVICWTSLMTTQSASLSLVVKYERWRNTFTSSISGSHSQTENGSTGISTKHNSTIRQLTAAASGNGYSEVRESVLNSSTGSGLEKMRHNLTVKDVNMSEITDIVDYVRLKKNADRVVNPHPFSYTFNAQEACEGGKTEQGESGTLGSGIFLIVYVHSAPAHFKHRAIIRQTWGARNYFRPGEVRVVFVLGVDETGGTQPAVAFESAQYGDIVQEDFRDTYRNLTYKAIAALKWVSTYCPHATFVLKTDDDIFVNMFTLLRHLHSVAEVEGKHKHLLLCLVWDGMPVRREGKWGVSERELKADFYPVYCSGSAFVMTTDVVVSMHEASYAVPFFWVDDFYVTGLLTMRVPDLDRRQFVSAYNIFGSEFEATFTGSSWYRHIFAHLFQLNSIIPVWDKVVDSNRRLIRDETDAQH
jgi:hypothetical protein